MPTDVNTPVKSKLSPWAVAPKENPPNWSIPPEPPKSNYAPLMAARRKAIDELTQLNQLRETVKTSVLYQIRTRLENTLAEPQLDLLLKHRGTLGELNRIVDHLTLKHHRNALSFADAAAKELEATIDPRLRMLVKMSSKNARDDFQTKINDSIEKSPEAKKSFRLVETKNTADGKESNQISESLEKASLTESSGRPRIDGIDKPIEDEVFAHIVTRQSLSENEASDLIDDVSARHGLSLSPERKSDLKDAILIASNELDLNDNTSRLRAELTFHQVDASTFQARLAADQLTTSDVIIDAYNPDNNAGSTISFNDIERFEQLINNHDIGGILEMPRLSPSDFIQRWQQYSNPGSGSGSTLSGEGFGFPPIGQGVPLQIPGDWVDPITSLFGSGGSSAGGGMGGGGLGNLLSHLGIGGGGVGTGTAAASGAAAGSTAASGAATAAAAGGALAGGGWTIAAIIGIILLFALIFYIAGASPNKVLMSQIDSVGGQGGGSGGSGFCNPKTDPPCPAAICAGDCFCPTNCGPITQGPLGGFSHKGKSNAIDVGLKECTDRSIFSISTGTVSFAGPKTDGYGNLIIITNPDGSSLYYAHLERFSVKKGDAVSKGTLLGIGDTKGNADGPHLHLEYKGPNDAPAANILNLFPFTDAEKAKINSCSSGGGCGICSNQ